MRSSTALALVLASGIAASVQAQPPRSPMIADAPVGRVEVRTIGFDPALVLRSGTYTPSGKILVSYAKSRGQGERDLDLAVMDDDGRNMHPVWSGALPLRPKDNGIRFMVFPDNKRVFLGDFILECAPSLDACSHSALLPVDYPAQVDHGEYIANRWSEMVVAPDNRHVAWDTLLANYSVLVFTGALERDAGRYRIVAPQIVSTIDPFKPDPRHPDGVLPEPTRGGEVKQFVDGGAGLSLAGGVRRDLSNSVVQDLASGRVEAITDTPGYTETTIFSPDERLGLTMTTRFSSTDPAILGLVPRPYATSLNMGLSMFAYTYAVTGVRRSRPGNVGPVLIDIQASKSQPGYLGRNLDTSPDWVFHSPMSWHPGGRKAMWMEGQRGTGAMRIQIAELQGYHPGPAISVRQTPVAPGYASSDMAVVSQYAARTAAIDVKVYGRTSGFIHYVRSGGQTEKTYSDFSDDGRATYNGREALLANPHGRSSYTADIRLSGPTPGIMALKVTFGPLGGSNPAKIVFAPDDTGQPATRGYVEYAGQRLDASKLVP
jgi:hypothetical protein